ncbi:MAG TPA: hypothetical protein VE462_14970 [Propionibacteriaceae bacterium]|nr:hypothetical protein [Propionibacteriaceae bacterium]
MVLGVVRVRVPRSQPDGEEFTGVVAPHSERVESESALEVRRRRGQLIQRSPHQAVVVAQRVDVGDRLPAGDQDRRQIDQYLSPVVGRDEPSTSQHLRQGGGQPDPISQQPDRGRTGQRHHSGPVPGNPCDQPVGFT